MHLPISSYPFYPSSPQPASPNGPPWTPDSVPSWPYIPQLFSVPLALAPSLYPLLHLQGNKQTHLGHLALLHERVLFRSDLARAGLRS